MKCMLWIQKDISLNCWNFLESVQDKDEQKNINVLMTMMLLYVDLLLTTLDKKYYKNLDHII